MQHVGAAGRSLNDARASGVFTAERAREGGRGERATFKMLDAWFAGDDDIHAFHDLTIPSRGGQKWDANVDHVLVRGHQIVIVDSKRWRSGNYWSVAGKCFRGGERFREAEKRTVGLAVDRYREHLRGDVAVWGVILVHPTGDGRTHLWALRPPDRVRIRVAAQGEPLLRALLGRPAPPDPDLLAQLWALRYRKQGG